MVYSAVGLAFGLLQLLASQVAVLLLVFGPQRVGALVARVEDVPLAALRCVLRSNQAAHKQTKPVVALHRYYYSYGGAWQYG